MSISIGAEKTMVINHYHYDFMFLLCFLTILFKKDIAMRMNAKNVCINRPPSYFSAYKMSQHQKSSTNPIRENLLFTSVKRMSRDGLSNVLDVTSIIDRISYGLYTKILINVGKKSLWSQVRNYIICKSNQIDNLI